ncbi:MAG TPA: epimerase [Myxococcales bacterium]|nr:epimerase [Myxococcales bacterium]HAN32467.1 epimerase [Myxococcales bacterium]|tara:strand:+ start:125 stop:1144 length:1020 start_codon:yes stop_codon:yes gene_type:complete
MSTLPAPAAVKASKQLSGQTVAITGGAGFIGSTLARRLSDDPTIEVVLFDNLHRDAVTASDLLSRDNVRLVRGDVRDKGALMGALAGAQHIIHMASIAGVDTVMNNPVLTMQVSMLGTMNVLEIAQSLMSAGHDIKRVVDFSTSEVFGRYAFRVTEGDATALGAVGEARWTYAVSKLATEHLCHNYFKQYDMPTVSIRPFNIYGPRQVGTGAIHHFIRKALADEALTVHNDGSQIRSWCYIDDIVDGILLVLTRPEAIGQSFNIGTPRSTVTIHQLANDIIRLSGSSSEVSHVRWDHPDVELRVPDISKARTLLDFNPRVDLQEGLKRTIAWYRQEMNQ